MDYNERERNRAGIDSRRVATGVTARIISDYEDGKEPSLKGLLALLRKYDHIPEHAHVDGITGYDNVSGAAFVIPLGRVEFVNEQLSAARNSIATKERKALSNITDPRHRVFFPLDEREVEFENYRNLVETELMQNIREHIIFVTMDVKDTAGNSRGIKAEKNHVYLDSIEQSPMHALPIPKKGIFDVKVVKSWTKDKQTSIEEF
jgi:hypothetical protein